jgi:hypothetical protein
MSHLRTRKRRLRSDTHAGALPSSSTIAPSCAYAFFRLFLRNFCASFGPRPSPSICAIRSPPVPDFRPDRSRTSSPRGIKRRPIASRLRSPLFPPSESQFLLFVRLICKQDSSHGQEALRDERSVWARRDERNRIDGRDMESCTDRHATRGLAEAS